MQRRRNFYNNRPLLDGERHHDGGKAEKDFMQYSQSGVKSKCLEDHSALMKAVETNNVIEFKKLVVLGAKPSVYRASDRNGIFHIAAEFVVRNKYTHRGNIAVLECMLSFPHISLLINDRNCRGETALHVSIKCSQAAAFERIFSFRKTKNHFKDKDGNTCLHLVVALEDSPAKTAILNRLTACVWNSSIPVHPQNKEGFTPLQYAIFLGQHKTVESMLFAKPGLIYAPGEQAMLPIHLAAAYARHEVLKILIKQTEGNIQQTKTGRTPLHFAVSRWGGNVENNMERLACIQTLLNERIEINAQDFDGNTAAHLIMYHLVEKLEMPFSKIIPLASELLTHKTITLEDLVSLFRPCWQLATVCYLCLKGADVENLVNSEGRNASSITNSKEIRELLRMFTQRRVRACIQMSRSQPHSFNAIHIAICTFACSDNVADVTFNPCNHRVICWECVEKTPLRRCPLCYNEIETIHTDDGRELAIIDDDSGEGKSLQIIESTAQEIRELEDKEKLEEINELRSRLEKLENETCCAICLDRRCSVVFQCGHLACKVCGNKPTLTKCHICRNKIVTRQPIFH